MKKIVSMLLSLAMLASLSITALAEDVSVYVNDALISFTDQAPVIVEDRTLVPARVVFQAMGCSVKWLDETKTAQIDSEDNLDRVYVTIGDNTMKCYHFTSVMTSDEKLVTLDVAPQIINDRTMLPLRAISEAFGAEVAWDPDTYTVSIVTEDGKKLPSIGGEEANVTIPTVSLSTDVDTVSEGDEVNVFVNIKSFPENAYLTTASALISYDKESFEFVDATLATDEGDVEATMGASNPDYQSLSAAKAAFVIIDEKITSDGAVMKFTFKALNNNGGNFALINSYELTRGYNTAFDAKKDGKNVRINGTNLVVDTTPVTVSGK